MSTAGYATTIKKGGTPVTITDEATTLVDGWIAYQLTDAAKRIFDPSTALVVKVDTVTKTIVTHYTVTEPLFGQIEMTLAGLGGDLITDGGFEAGLGSWFTIGTSVAIVQSSAQARLGTKSLKATTSAGSPDDVGSGVEIATNPTGGKVYRSRVYVRAGTANLNGKTCRLAIEESGGAQATAETFSTAVVTNTGWTAITHSHTVVEADRTSLKIRVHVPTGAITNDELHVDDAAAILAPTAITISGKYVPTVNLAGAHAYALDWNVEDKDKTEYNTNGGYRQHLPGILDVGLSVDRWDDLTGDLRTILRARNSVLIEIQPGASGEIMRGWFRPLTEERSGDVSAIEAANMQFVASDVQSPPFRYRAA